MMAKAPDERFADMAQVREALAPFAQRQPVRIDFPKILTERIAAARRRAQRQHERKRRESDLQLGTLPVRCC